MSGQQRAYDEQRRVVYGCIPFRYPKFCSGQIMRTERSRLIGRCQVQCRIYISFEPEGT
jgi:hypothetical protein